MPDNALTTFTAAAARRASPLSPQFQLRLARHAIAENDHDTLSALLSRNDLTADTDALIGTVTNPATRAASDPRPERNEDDLLATLKNEARIDVLETVAARPDLPEAVYQHLLGRPDHKRPLLAVITDTTAPDDVRTDAVNTFLDNHMLDLQQTDWGALATDEVTASATIRARPDFDTITTLCWNPVPLDVDATTIVGAVATEVLERHFTAFTTTDIGTVTHPDVGALFDDVRLVARLLQSTAMALHLSDPNRRLNQLDTEQLDTQQLGDALDAVDFDLDYVATHLRPSGLAPGPDGLIAAVTDAGTDDDIQALLDYARHRYPSNSSWPLYTAVTAGLANPAASVDTIRTHANKIGFTHREGRWLAAIVDAHDHDTTVGAALLSHIRSSYLPDEPFDWFKPGDPQALWRTVFYDRLPSPDDTATNSTLLDVLYLFDHDAADPAAVADLPWQLFRTLYDLGARTRTVTHHTITLIDTVLGDDPDMLENFMMFGATHQGTIGELIEIARLHSEMSSIRRT